MNLFLTLHMEVNTASAKSVCAYARIHEVWMLIKTKTILIPLASLDTPAWAFIRTFT